MDEKDIRAGAFENREKELEGGENDEVSGSRKAGQERLRKRQFCPVTSDQAVTD